MGIDEELCDEARFGQDLAVIVEGGDEAARVDG
jgi:hypothetical protein